MRYCADIGMWAIDRPIPVSCVHATEFCWKSCYNSKLYKAFPSMRTADERYELEWQNLDPKQVKAFLAGRRKPVMSTPFAVTDSISTQSGGSRGS